MDQKRMTIIVMMLIIVMPISAKVNCYKISHPPCYFNPLCTCTKTMPNLGIVSCVDIPLPRIPVSFNFSVMNGLNLENNNLRVLENYTFYGTGISTLSISNNPIYIIPREMLNGLEFSLRELELSYTKLIDVPTHSLSQLKKLRILNLSGNQIAEINSYSWVGIEDSLESLILNENAIIHISRNAFGGFKKLKLLDLSKNLIMELPPNLFQSSLSGHLMYIYLNDNRLQHMPYSQLQDIRILHTLDLSYNFIEDLLDMPSLPNSNLFPRIKLSLNILRLDHNRINVLPGAAFRHFESLDKVYLDGNRIEVIYPDAFYNIPISELSVVKCSLKDITGNTFQGLEKSLRSLDLSNNNLFFFPRYLLEHFERLKSLTICDNPLDTILIPEMGCNLEEFDIRGQSNIYLSVNSLSRMKNLRLISLSKCRKHILSMDDFQGFGPSVEEVSITNAELKIIKAHTFFHINRVVKVDFSFNSISDINADVFMEIAHSLQYLHLAQAFSSLITIPVDIFRHLVNLQFLDLSYNKVEVLHEITLHSLRKLRTIHLHDCQINVLHRNTFQGYIHTELRNVLFSYNFLKVVSSYTFADLKELRRVNLEDNLIVKIEKNAFLNLENVRTILLRGNKITTIDNEAFQNLPTLEVLDLAHNKLAYFDFVFFDQVGTMAISTLNVSFNHLHSLGNEIDYVDHDMVFSANIEIIDMSHNNISTIAAGYFHSVKSSLLYFYFSWNLISNLTCEFFDDLNQLQWLDLSHNRIFNVESCAFRHNRKLQVLYMNHNFLHDLPFNLFSGMINLRVVDFTHNKLKLIPDYLLREDSLQQISFGYNQLILIPFKSFTQEAAKFLCELDLSYNLISVISSPALFSKFETLTSLDLSGNNINRLADSAFKYLTKLVHLDLSHNSRLNIEDRQFIFDGLENSLQTLHMKNMSLKMSPNLQFSTLLHLHLNENNIFDLEPELTSNISTLRSLDISGNMFSNIPVAILSLPNLRRFSFAANNITILTNTSLLNGIPYLRILDLSNIPLNILEMGTLNKLQSLYSLDLNLQYELDDFNIPAFISENSALHHLHIIADKYVLGKQMFGKFPPKLCNMVITGRILKIIEPGVFDGISCTEFSLILTNTSIETLPHNLFYNVGHLESLNLDIRGNQLKSISNQLIGDRTLNQLSRVHLSENQWNCDCEMGWIGVWNRKRRQMVCAEYDSDEQELCYKTSDDFRKIVCQDSENPYLLDVLKNDLDCAWNSGFKITFPKLLLIAICFIYLRDLYSYPVFSSFI